MGGGGGGGGGEEIIRIKAVLSSTGLELELSLAKTGTELNELTCLKVFICL